MSIHHSAPISRASTGRPVETPVLIVGAGPVGLLAAMDLAWRGIPSVVVEQRYPGEPPPVKCNHVAARSMETFRRLGFAERVRDAGLPHDYPNDAVFLNTFTGYELGRIPIPSRSERRLPPSDRFPDSSWPTAEPPHRINQIYLEPILFDEAKKRDLVTIHNRMRLVDFTQDEAGVTATVLDLDTDETRVVRARYMIACDGGRSGVRKKLGVNLVGTAQIGRYLSTHIRAPALLGMIGHRRPGWMNHACNARRTGNAIAIDGKEQWLVHCHVKAHEKDFADIDRDRAIRDVLGVDDSFEYEVLSKEDWIARRLVAERFRDGRVFLCGDAAHIWIPVAGYGMNAGIADAMNLTFMLAAHLKGWGSTDMLDAYELERQPITEQLSRFVGGLGSRLMRERAAYGAILDDPGPAGDAARSETGRMLVEMNTPQLCCAGLNFAYFYDNSPLIAYDGETPPPYTLGRYEPSTAPGVRAPHIRLADGRTLYDALGKDYTLLRFDRSVDVGPLFTAAGAAGLPLDLLDVESDEAASLYRHKLLVCRSDQHVVWRGDRVPREPAELVAKLAGRDKADFERRLKEHRRPVADTVAAVS
jgi:2-polyprenyl-6-methoxyphenol hydroxylase-like FAD-dependent oxidoreductase